MTQGRQRGEGGFTLTEVAVVAIILSILAAIALTTYYVQVAKAQRSAVISTLGNLDVAAETIKLDLSPQEFSGDPSLYEDELRAIDFVGGTSVSRRPDEISVHAPDGTYVSFAGQAGGTCYYLRLENVGRGRVEHRESMTDVSCRADEFEPSDGLGSDGWG